MSISHHNIILTFILSFLGVIGSFAQFSTIELKDGSIFKGYIASQRPGSDITIHSFDAEMYVVSGDVKNIEDVYVAYNNLPIGWKRYYIKSKGNNIITQHTMKLQDMQMTGGFHRFVNIEERGVKYKYTQHAEDNYVVKWSDIKRISKVKLDAADLKLYDEITTSDGNVYVGQIIEQTPGETIKIFLRGGDINVIDAGSITITSKIPVNGTNYNWSERPYTNIVRTADGEGHTGLIISQLSDSEGNGYIKFLNQDKNIVEFKYVDISEYIVKPYKTNYNYERNCIYVNDITLKETEALQGNGIIYFTDLTSNVIPIQQGNMLLMSSMNALDEWKIRHLENVNLEDSRKAKGCYESALTQQNPLTFENNADGTSTSTLANLKTGYYIIANISQYKYYLVNIK